MTVFIVVASCICKLLPLVLVFCLFLAIYSAVYRCSLTSNHGSAYCVYESCYLYFLLVAFILFNVGVNGLEASGTSLPSLGKDLFVC